MKTIKLLALLMAVAIAGYGCGNSSVAGSADQVAANGGPTDTVTAAPAEKATVTFKVKFPAKSGVGKSRIDDSVAAIYVYSSGACGYASAYLYPDATTGIASETFDLQAGECYFGAYAYDSSWNFLDQAYSAGALAAGANQVKLTFLEGTWTFVASTTDLTETPVVLSDGTSLAKFWLTADGSWPTSAASIDTTKSYQDQYYMMKWWTSDGNPLGYDDSTAPYGVDTNLSHLTQFTGGTTNASVIDGGWFNLTGKSANDDYMNAGDRFVAIAGDQPDKTDTFSPDITAEFDSTVADGNTITGHIFEGTFGSTSGTYTEVSSCDEAMAAKSRAAALTKAASGVRKAGAIGDVTISFTECFWTYDADADGDMDWSDDWWSDNNANGTCDEGEAFVDANANGVYDDGEPFTDADANGIYDGPEMMSDYDSDGKCDYTVSVYGYVEYDVTQTLTGVVSHPFTAKGSSLGALAGSTTEVIIQKQGKKRK